jgi:hypothetical protein
LDRKIPIDIQINYMDESFQTFYKENNYIGKLLRRIKKRLSIETDAFLADYF